MSWLSVVVPVIYSVHLVELEKQKLFVLNMSKNITISQSKTSRWVFWPFLWNGLHNFFQADSENDPDLRNRVEIRHTNGKFGWLKNTAEDIYDVIHIGISFPEDLSKENWKQLRVGGRIVSENADISPRRKMSFSDGFKGKSKKSEIRIL